MTLVAVSGLYIEIPPEAIPAPPASSASIVRAFVASRHGLKSTTSIAFEPSGVKQAVAVTSACRIRVQVSGLFGHTSAGAFIHAGVARNGAMLENDAILASARLPGPYDVAHFAIDILDEIASVGVYEYELYVRQTDQTSGATGYVGRRAQNTDPNVLTTISLTVLDPL